MEGRIVPSIRRVKNQSRDGGLEAHPGYYALIFAVLPISPYTQITISKKQTSMSLLLWLRMAISPANNLS